MYNTVVKQSSVLLVLVLIIKYIRYEYTSPSQGTIHVLIYMEQSNSFWRLKGTLNSTKDNNPGSGLNMGL